MRHNWKINLVGFMKVRYLDKRDYFFSMVLIFIVILELCHISIYADENGWNRKKTQIGVGIEEEYNIKGVESEYFLLAKGTDLQEDHKGKDFEAFNQKNQKVKDEVLGPYDFQKPLAEDESYTWLIFKTILILAILVGGFYYFFRFVTKKTGVLEIGKDVVQILSIVPLGQNRFLQIIDLAGRVIVLGVTENSINLIIEIKDKDEANRIRLLSSKSSPVKSGGFQEYVSKYLTKVVKKGDGLMDFSDKLGRNSNIEDSEVDRLNFLNKQRDRLKKIDE